MSGLVSASYDGPEKLTGALVYGRVEEGHFEIPRLEPGRYRLVFFPDARTGLVYYPGTKVAKDATLIELGEGAHVDQLEFVVF